MRLSPPKGQMASNNKGKSVADMERAQAAFNKKEVAQREGAVAMAEYQAGLKAERAKTEKLRAMRLAKEAHEANAAAIKAAAEPKKKLKPGAKPEKKKKPKVAIDKNIRIAARRK
jgi:hypothetical protein